MRLISPVRSTLLALTLGLATPAGAADATDAGFRAAADELLTWLRTEEQLARVRATMVRREVESDKRWKEFQGELAAHLEQYMGWETMRETVIERYASIFSEEELRAILAFYQSPAGVKVLTHMERLKEEAFYSGVEAARANLDELRFKMLEEGQRKAAEDAKKESSTAQ